MTRFEACLKFVLTWEGGYVNDPDDRGGATNKGITQAVYDDYRAARSLGQQPVVGIGPDEVCDIYRTRYWNRVRGDELPTGLDLALFDAAVNTGVDQSVKFLQRALAVKDDGLFGNKTMAALKREIECETVHVLLADVLDQRRRFYEGLVEKRPVNRKFLNGWLARVKALALEVF